MAKKLSFRYATMGSGKSLEIIQIHFNFKKCEKNNGLLMVSDKDTRGGAGTIYTRIGLSVPALAFNEEEDLFKTIKKLHEENPIDYIIIDEANFLTPKQVDQLGDVVDYLNIDVMAYGILTDFKTELFEGSKRLMEVADEKKEISIRTICWCGRKAVLHGRIVNGEFVEEGDSVVIDDKDDVQYVSICRQHHKERAWKKHNK